MQIVSKRRKSLQDSDSNSSSLACIGTDNKFSAELVLKRWAYIVSECRKCGITVTSFGADGDSWELKAMQVSVGLLSSQCSLTSPWNVLKKLNILSDWSCWFAAKKAGLQPFVMSRTHGH